MPSAPESLPALLPALHALPKADKLRVIQHLVADLAGDEAMIQPGATYPIWSPFNEHAAAATMLEELQKLGTRS